MLFCPGKQLEPACLPEEFHRPSLSNSSFVIPPLVPMEEIEREAICKPSNALQVTLGAVLRSFASPAPPSTANSKNSASPSNAPRSWLKDPTL